MSLPPPEQRFKNQVVSLSKYIVDINNDAQNRGIQLISSNSLSIGAALVENISGETMMIKFIERSWPHWEKIRLKSTAYFKDQALNFFEGVPENAINAVKTLLMDKDENGQPYVVDKVREIIWTYMHNFVKISLKFLAPQGGNVIPQPIYKEYLEKWEITLS